MQFTNYIWNLYKNSTQGKKELSLLEDTFLQARSYALRLKSLKIILADRDFIWLFEKHKDDFKLDTALKFHWNDLTNSDNLYLLKSKL